MKFTRQYPMILMTIKKRIELFVSINHFFAVSLYLFSEFSLEEYIGISISAKAIRIPVLRYIRMKIMIVTSLSIVVLYSYRITLATNFTNMSSISSLMPNTRIEIRRFMSCCTLKAIFRCYGIIVEIYTKKCPHF